MQIITSWIEQHPYLFNTFIWPVISAVVLAIFKPRTPEQYARMNPRLAGILMLVSGLGLDLHKALEGVQRALTGRSIPLDQAQADELLKKSSIRPPPPPSVDIVMPSGEDKKGDGQ